MFESFGMVGHYNYIVARRLATDWTVLIRSQVSRVGNFSSFLRVQTVLESTYTPVI